MTRPGRRSASDKSKQGNGKNLCRIAIRFDCRKSIEATLSGRIRFTTYIESYGAVNSGLVWATLLDAEVSEPPRHAHLYTNHLHESMDSSDPP